MEVAVCKYRGRVIGFLIGDRYLKHEVPLGKNGRRIRRNWPPHMVPTGITYMSTETYLYDKCVRCGEKRL